MASWGRLFAAVLAACIASLAPSAPVVANEASVWIELLDAQGQSVESIATTELRVEEGVTVRRPAFLGRPLRVANEKARVVLYIDQAFGGRGALGRSSEALAEVARDLTQLGDVELVIADQEPSLQLRGAEALVLSERLRRMALTERGEPRIQNIRRDALRRFKKSARAQPPIDLEVRIGDLVAAIEEEHALVSTRLQQMVTWLTRPQADGGGPRLVFLASEGFDLDPTGFYVSKLEPQAGQLLAQTISSEKISLAPLDGQTRNLARTLAASGWIAVPLTMPVESFEQKASEFSALETGDENQRTSAPGIVLRPGKLFKRGSDEENEPTENEETALQAPQAPLELFANAGGGFLVKRPSELIEAVERLGNLRRLAWPEGLEYDDGLTPIEVTVDRPGLVVRAPRWRSRGIPAPLAGLRLDEVLAAGEAGELTLVAVLEVSSTAESDGLESGDGAAPTRAVLDARLDLHDLEDAAELRRSDLRVTVEALGLSGERQILQEVIREQDLAAKREWTLRRDLELPADATAVAVVVEDMSSGLWGGRRATVVRSGGDTESFLPAPASLEVQRPDMALLRGRVSFEVAVFDAQISRLQFLLDDREVARRDRPPWAARLDLGRTPRRQTLTVVGYNASGSEVGRDSVILNGGDAGLSVSIVEPTTSKAIGPIDVEANISIPVERRLDRVIFFWNNEQVATLFAAPFRQRVIVPEDRPVGYVRVVAMLDDGSLSEDVKFMNGPEAGESIEVNLVELYVVVTDDDGRPVRGLEQSEFAVREEGVPQSIATFSDAADLPLTLGMAIDSSASMFVKLPKVQKAASDFLRSTFGANDRSFVVDFDSTPRLARGTTNDVERVVDSIYGLEASGRTALWESIVFSLVQLQGVRGRKALVVFSDGADEDDQFPFRTCQRIAKEMGVPIYLILMKKKPEQSAFKGLLSRSFTSRATRLTRATGGRVFYAKEYQDLGEVYAEIETELRSQYLLAYYPQNVDRERGWRDVDVDLVRRDLKPRTLTGYWQ